MNVVLVGLFFPMAILRYFERALKRRSDVNLFTAGPYTGRKIPWNAGMLLPEKYAIPPDLKLPDSESVPVEMVENRLPWVPDVWVQVDSVWSLRGRPVHGKNLIVGVDPHCVDYSRSRRWADTFFCMQTPYMKENDIWLPFAYDPDCHVNLRRHRPFDVGYVGAPYSERVRITNALSKVGFSVDVRGYGPIFDEYALLSNQYKVGLNVSTKKDLCARVFELSAMGCAPLVNRVPDLDKVGFVEGVHYWGFNTSDEAVEGARWLLDADRWMHVADSAQEFIEPHTWDARVEKVLSYA